MLCRNCGEIPEALAVDVEANEGGIKVGIVIAGGGSEGERSKLSVVGEGDGLSLSSSSETCGFGSSGMGNVGNIGSGSRNLGATR